jgi:hypothetical protein
MENVVDDNRRLLAHGRRRLRIRRRADVAEREYVGVTTQPAAFTSGLDLISSGGDKMREVVQSSPIEAQAPRPAGRVLCGSMHPNLR